MNSSELSKGTGIVGALLIKMAGGVFIGANAGSPSSGTSGTWFGTFKALPGSLLVDTTNKKLYINTNTKASPTWTVVGSQS